MTLFTADGLIWPYERMRESGSGSYNKKWNLSILFKVVLHTDRGGNQGVLD